MPRKRSVHPIIRQIISRDCHVSMGVLSVIKHVVGKLRDGRQTFKAMSRRDKRRFIRDCAYVHRENVALYKHVMWGIR